MENCKNLVRSRLGEEKNNKDLVEILSDFCWFVK